MSETPNIPLRDHVVPVNTEYTAILTRWLADLHYDALPQGAPEAAKAAILRVLSRIFSAYGTNIAANAEKLGLEQNGGVGGPVPDLLTGSARSAASAALTAGILADDEISDTALDIIVPAAVVAALERHTSGKELITAIAGAYELHTRIAAAFALTPDQKSAGRGLRSVRLLSATAAAAKLYGLGPYQIEQAIGIAGEHNPIPSGYSELYGNDTRRYLNGYRTRDAILAAKQSEKGIFNQQALFDIIGGFGERITDEPKRELLVKNLGSADSLPAANLTDAAGIFQKFAVPALGTAAAAAVADAISALETVEDAANAFRGLAIGVEGAAEA